MASDKIQSLNKTDIRTLRGKAESPSPHPFLVLSRQRVLNTVFRRTRYYVDISLIKLLTIVNLNSQVAVKLHHVKNSWKRI